ncbi:MAG: sigma-70 family RNA polymerase sigma factor [Acutalibacteraceae bacterium]
MSASYDEDLLLLRVKEGDKEAFEQIALRYIPLISTLSSAYKAEGYDTDDFNQEGLMCLYVAAKKYDKARDISFKNYASICIKNKFLSIIRGQSRKKDIPKNIIKKIEDTSEDEFATDSTSPENIMEEKFKYQRLLKNISDKLSPLENDVLSLYMKGYSYEETATSLNISPKSVDNALTRIRTKLGK